MRTLKSIILVSSIVLILGCQKDDFDVTVKDVNSIDYINDRLVFSSLDCYEELVNDLINSPDDVFKILLRKNNSILKSTNVLNDSLYDDFLQSILSPDKIVEIGEWIIKVDLENNRISVINEKDIQYIDELKNDQFNEKILLFTPDQEVLILLDSIMNDQNGLKSTEGIFCDDRWAARETDKDFEYMGETYRLDCKVVYQKAGIYFSLEAKMKNQVRDLGIWHERDNNLELDYNGSWSKRCGNSGTAKDTKSTWDHVLDARVYSSTRALKHYSYSAVFRNKNANYWTRLYSISD